MVQTYQGYFQRNGQFKPLDSYTTEIPKHMEVYVLVTGKPLTPPTDTESDMDNMDTLEKRATAIRSLKGIIPPDFKFELDDIRRERIEKRGLVE